MKIERFNLKQI